METQHGTNPNTSERCCVGNNTELIADLRATIQRQQAIIDRLLRQHFGRSSERDTGPTLFDGIDDTELSITDSEVSSIDNELTLTDTEVSVSKRKGMADHFCLPAGSHQDNSAVN